MLAILGATGKTGQALVKALQAKGAAFKCVVRDTSRAAEVLGSDVDLVHGDLDQPDRLAAAFSGADQLFLLSGQSPNIQDQQIGAVEAAKAAGVKHIIYGSGSEKCIRSDCPVPVMAQMYGVEEAIKASGLEWTMLRPNFFMQNLLNAAPQVQGMGKIMLPLSGETPISMIDVRDTADVAAAIITGGGHQGQAYFLTGAQVTMNDVAAELSAQLDREISFVQVPPEGARKAMEDRGMPEWLIHHQVTVMGLVDSGDMSHTTDWVEKISGHAPRTLHSFIADHIGAFS